MDTDNMIKDEIAHYIGNKILELRKSHKLSREQFAEKNNLSANYIYEIEKGNSVPGCIALIDICNTFEIAPSSLLDKYLNLNVSTANELVISDYQKLSNYDKKLVIDMINLMANRKKQGINWSLESIVKFV